jgi:outer membrane lipoprotein-sorting protein
MRENIVEDFTSDVVSGEYGYESIHGSKKAIETVDGAKRETAAEVWEIPPDKSRVESRPLREATPSGDEVDESAGESADVFELVVRNSDVLWQYDKETNRYDERQLDPSTKTPNQVGRPQVIEAVINSGCTIKQTGFDEIAGYEVCVLVASPSDVSNDVVSGIDELEMWVSTDHRFPLRHRVSYSSSDGDIVTECEWMDTEFDVSIDDDTFEFAPAEK